METEVEKYQEIVEIKVPEGEGVLFVKVITLPFQDGVEFDTAQARKFALSILDAAERVERQCEIKPT